MVWSLDLLSENVLLFFSFCLAVDPTTQFRGSSLPNKIMYYYAKRVGEAYLEQTLKPLVEGVGRSGESLEAFFLFACKIA